MDRAANLGANARGNHRVLWRAGHHRHHDRQLSVPQGGQRGYPSGGGETGAPDNYLPGPRTELLLRLIGFDWRLI
jgi:hypothetical protein